MRPRLVVLSGLLWAAAVTSSPLAGAFEACGPLSNAYGPFDFYVDRDKLPIVESNHFNAGVEFFRKRMTGPFGGDIDYTLRAFPNHPRALAAMVRLGELEKADRPQGANYTVQCYLERAIRFRPNDASARLMIASYLIKHGREADADGHLGIAVANAGDNGNIHYNIGLVFYRLKRFDEALFHAHTAYRLGFDLPGLKNLLVSAGHWKEEDLSRVSK